MAKAAGYEGVRVVELAVMASASVDSEGTVRIRFLGGPLADITTLFTLFSDVDGLWQRQRRLLQKFLSTP